MAVKAKATLESRKTPVQARSANTVVAISEATIQVLLKHGADRLTTTRVAERAGVSVGTLYQYYPNKESLLFAILKDHIENLWRAIETACWNARGKPPVEIIKDVVEAFVDAKMKRSDISIALYRIAPEIGGPALVRRTSARAQKALESAFRATPKALPHHSEFATQMMFAAMAGTTRAVLEAGASPAMVQQLRVHLVLLCQSYLRAANQPHFLR
jgi:AcrR family transcriptional regulator